MLYQAIIAAGLTVFLVNLVLNLRHLRVPDVRAAVPRRAPLVSVLVPARDEEATIRACLESLLRQDYPAFEVLVLDDNSEDNTAAVVSEMAARDKRLRLVQGLPLPEDWAGKPFACHQLAERARGSWFLFVDADTTHAPNMLRSVLALAMETRASLLSGFPRQLADTLPLKIVMPLMYFVILGWLPLWWLQRQGHTRPSLAIGQFMLFSAAEYRRIGGHKVVQSRIVEDVWLGIETSRRGGRHVVVDLSTVVSCEMYRNLTAAWSGLGRSIYSITAMMPVGLVGLVLAAYFFYVAPWYWFLHGFFLADASAIWRAVVGCQVAVILLIRWLIDTRLKEPGISVWFHVIGFLFLFVNVLWFGGRWLVGAGVTWKERLYGREESVVK
jgi:chlorobactene glucosyltransferase